ncbi:MAG TPA: hypothetical protein PKE66_04990, partial [Pyrinomonadaceae bacterium]|nr:hypothetical protein [Pyrinomonadaceae bacterium]
YRKDQSGQYYFHCFLPSSVEGRRNFQFFENSIFATKESDVLGTRMRRYRNISQRERSRK